MAGSVATVKGCLVEGEAAAEGLGPGCSRRVEAGSSAVHCLCGDRDFCNAAPARPAPQLGLCITALSLILTSLWV